MSSTPKFRRESFRPATCARRRIPSKRSRRCSAASCSTARPGTTSATWSSRTISSAPITSSFSRASRRSRARRSPAIRSRCPSTCSDSASCKDAGGLAYLGTLTRDTPGAANARAYAEIVKERALLRELVSAGGEIAGSVWSEEGESARDLVEKAERRIFAIAEGSARGKGYISAQAGAAAR